MIFLQFFLFFSFFFLASVRMTTCNRQTGDILSPIIKCTFTSLLRPRVRLFFFSFLSMSPHQGYFDNTTSIRSSSTLNSRSFLRPNFRSNIRIEFESTNFRKSNIIYCFEIDFFLSLSFYFSFRETPSKIRIISLFKRLPLY